ncbi:MAG TPA: type II secretion system protein [Gemmatimonadaceae bacterium]|nr:type II secretion system protein [Gemmatimonadaceae bacterium]
MKNRPAAREGFTLVETLVVIVILAIVTAVTIPAFQSTPEDELARAAGVVSKLMQRARQTAVERSQNVSLVVDAEHARYWATIQRAGNTDSLVSFGGLDLASGATLTSDEPRSRFVFTPSGMASGPPLVLRLDSRSAVITVARWTGDAHARVQ